MKNLMIMKILLPAMFCSVFFPALCYAKEPIYIGLSAPMTGRHAETGKSFKTGIELAIEQINKDGGLNGSPIALIVEDSQDIPKLAKRIAVKFTRDQRIAAVIGDFTSTCSLAAQSVYRKARMVQVSPTSSQPLFARGSPYSFGICGTQAEKAPFIARTAVNTLGKKRLAVLYVNDEWGLGVKKYFVEEGKRLGREIVGVEPYFKDTTDFTPFLEKLRAAKPDFLCLGSLVDNAARISRQRRKLGWDDVTVMGSVALHTPRLIELGRAAVEDVFAFTFFYPKSSQPQVRKFVKDYETGYGQTPTWFAAAAYDAMNLLARAIREAGPDRQGVRDALAAISNFSGVTGNITFTEYGNVSRDHLLLQVKNGEFVLYPHKEK